MTSFIFMGVAGCGKSTLGETVAERLGLPFIEADDFHPEANIKKMSSGIALTDRDRAPWVERLIQETLQLKSDTERQHSIMACSALSKFVRKALRHGLHGDANFIHLRGESGVLISRLKARENHFFDPNLLPSQFTALSAPRRALTLDITHSVDDLTAKACAYIEQYIKPVSSAVPLQPQ